MRNYIYTCAVILLLALAANAAETEFSFVGTTKGSAAWSPCGSTTSAPTAMGNFTIGTAGVRRITVLAETGFGVQVYIYSQAPAADACAGLIKLSPTQNGLGDIFGHTAGGPVLDDALYLASGLHFIVVTGPLSSSQEGYFAINIESFAQVGQTVRKSTTDHDSIWAFNVTVGQANDCDTASNDFEKIMFQFISTGGNYDISVMFYNNTLSSWTTQLGVWSGTASATGLYTDPCDNAATGATFTASVATNSRAAVLYNKNMPAGTYTIAFSSQHMDELGYYALSITPTRNQQFSAAQSFVQPTRTVTCAASGLTSAQSFVKTFDALGPAVFVTTEQAPGYTAVATYSFLYAGQQTTPIPDTSCATLNGQGSSFPAKTSTGSKYSVVVSTDSGTTAPSNSGFVLYTYSGQWIGVIPAVNTTVNTTDDTTTTSTTTAPVTTATTSGGVISALTTTGLGNDPSFALSIHSSTSVFVTLFFVVASLVLVML